MTDVTKTNELIAALRPGLDNMLKGYGIHARGEDITKHATAIATRVHVQGEPNGEREVLADVIAEHEEYPHPRGYLDLADAIIAAGFSRTTGPDEGEPWRC